MYFASKFNLNQNLLKLKQALKGLLIICIAIFSAVSAFAESNYKLQSVFIVRFAKYIEWPENYKSGDFVIGVLGDDEAESAIKTTCAGKTVGNQKITIRKFNSVAEIGNCNILYITFAKSSNFYAASSKLKSKSTLIITEKDGLAQKGSNINLVVNQGKMNFEVNKIVNEKSGLKIPASILSLATVY